MKNSKNTAHRIVIAALIAALCTVATMIIKVPSPTGGYVNIGDSVVILAGWMLSPVYAFLAAAVGSALADVFAGYIVYVPATFLIKGIMALAAFFLARAIGKKTGNLVSKLLSGIAAEIIMIGGYLVFEGFLYGFASALTNVPANAVQGAISLVLGVLLAKVFEKTKIQF
jgi:uncharacterized membrane protein